MILVFDVGNSEIDLGVVDKHGIKAHFRHHTANGLTEQELGLFVTGMLRRYDLAEKRINGIGICSVVPEINHVLEGMSREFFRRGPLWIRHGIKLPVRLLLDSPETVGFDRVANASWAYKKYKSQVIVIDFGTATTFSVVNAKGEFLGGAIMPGLITTKQALAARAAKLPPFELPPAAPFIGNNTVAAMRSGVLNGYIGAVGHIIEGMKKELGGKSPMVVATGGQSGFLGPLCPEIVAIEPGMTLLGLELLYSLNV